MPERIRTSDLWIRRARIGFVNRLKSKGVLGEASGDCAVGVQLLGTLKAWVSIAAGRLSNPDGPRNPICS